MRSLIARSILALLALAHAPDAAPAQAPPVLPAEDRIRIAEARRLFDRLGTTVWPGWSGTALEVLLVGDSAEFLVGRRSRGEDFTPLGPDSLLGAEVWTRPRHFPPTLLATFPVGGISTVVVGSAERTGKRPAAWVLTLLHEQFHRWQYSLPDYYEAVGRLELAGGDTTGRWMLDYPFPYDSPPVQMAMRELGTALARALRAEPAGPAVRDVIARRDVLRARLSAADERYLEFQLWQEGVARFIEYAVARAAAEAGMRFGGESYRLAADSGLGTLRRELEELDLGRQRRVALYPVGAAMALLLDETRPGWKGAYRERPLRLSDLLTQEH
ncbi:MAG TPA: hypothetical protein VEB59_07165 [Gemmatimonadales bacterium]|nr:hypothetical protein [Gemmatimonadales bacterium]